MESKATMSDKDRAFYDPYLRKRDKRVQFEHVSVSTSVRVTTRCDIPKDDAGFYDTLNKLADGLFLKDDGGLYRDDGWGDHNLMCDRPEEYPELEVVLLAARLKYIITQEKQKIEKARSQRFDEMRKALPKFP